LDLGVRGGEQFSRTCNLPPEGWARVAVTTYREFKADRILAEQNFDSTDDDWRGALERNLIQTVRMMRRALPHMNGRPGAAVINVASISGWSPQLAMSAQYGAAKVALIFDTERWALEFVPHGIRVNTVSPGSILVEGNGWDRYRRANPGYFEDYVRHGFPMGRLGTAEEIADVIVFLASPRAYWINGRNIPVVATPPR
jgi:3-oxoacyl-[acyl-carrier protein] reductase